MRKLGVELVSVHFPKAGGSSLRDSLVAAFGGLGTVLLDYGDDPADPASSYNLDPEGCREQARRDDLHPRIRDIHGHFHPSKHFHQRDVPWITFLRHPVDTLVSIYYFWKTESEGHALFRYVRHSQMELLDMARVPMLRYLMSRTYFGGVDMARFDFIGLHEHYEADCGELARMLDLPLLVMRANVNRFPGYRDQVEQAKADRRTMTKFGNLLIEDVKFYETLARR